MTAKTIKADEWYTPNTIAKNLWVVNRNNKSYHNFVLKQIKLGKLKADVYGETKNGVPFYRVLGKWIIEYRKKLEAGKN